jgi:hypothetical protein
MCFCRWETSGLYCCETFQATRNRALSKVQLSSLKQPPKPSMGGAVCYFCAGSTFRLSNRMPSLGLKIAPFCQALASVVVTNVSRSSCTALEEASALLPCCPKEAWQASRMRRRARNSSLLAVGSKAFLPYAAYLGRALRQPRCPLHMPTTDQPRQYLYS